METKTTLSEQKPLRGQTVIITGASDGIGAAAAKQLQAQGADVVLVGRSPNKTQAVAKRLKVPYYVADFADLSHVRELAAKILKDHRKIDVLCNNAGLAWGSQRTLTKDGHEMTFQVNYVAPFLLTHLLKERLIASKARIINTSSRGNLAASAHVDLHDLDSSQGYTPMKAYTTTKLETIMFTKELNRRWGDSGIKAVCFHPGDVRSNFGRTSTPAVRFLVSSPLKYLFITPEKAAQDLVWLATSQPGRDWQSGGYYSKRQLTQPNPQADDPEVCRGLWDQSLRLLNLSQGA